MSVSRPRALVAVLAAVVCVAAGLGTACTVSPATPSGCFQGLKVALLNTRLGPDAVFVGPFNTRDNVFEFAGDSNCGDYFTGGNAFYQVKTAVLPPLPATQEGNLAACRAVDASLEPVGGYFNYPGLPLVVITCSRVVVPETTTTVPDTSTTVPDTTTTVPDTTTSVPETTSTLPETTTTTTAPVWTFRWTGDPQYAYECQTLGRNPANYEIVAPTDLAGTNFWGRLSLRVTLVGSTRQPANIPGGFLSPGGGFDIPWGAGQCGPEGTNTVIGELFVDDVVVSSDTITGV